MEHKKVIDRTEPSVTSLELSKKITEALAGIGVRVETYWWWCKHKKERYKIINLDYIVRYEPSYVSEIPAYTSDDLMALLPEKIEKEGRRFARKIIFSNFYLMCRYEEKCFGSGRNIASKDIDLENINYIEALGKLLVYLIEEGVIADV